jgi:NADH-quinone oxidoreductase subunit J
MNSIDGQLPFLIMSVLTLGSALVVVRVRNIVHAGFWLLPCFLGIAGLYALLEAHFFVVVQVLIYVGAILVLMLFALMLTQDVMNPNNPQTNRMSLPIGIFCVVFAAGVAAILTGHPWLNSHEIILPASVQTRQLGQALIGEYARPFEIASVLLLAALVGAIVLAKSEKEPPPLPLPTLEELPDTQPE